MRKVPIFLPSSICLNPWGITSTVWRKSGLWGLLSLMIRCPSTGNWIGCLIKFGTPSSPLSSKRISVLRRSRCSTKPGRQAIQQQGRLFLKDSTTFTLNTSLPLCPWTTTGSNQRYFQISCFPACWTLLPRWSNMTTFWCCSYSSTSAMILRACFYKFISSRCWTRRKRAYTKPYARNTSVARRRM